MTGGDPLLQGGWLLTAAALVGLVAGSFLNVVIHRLPRMLERRWREECAELTGAAAPPPAPAYNLVTPPSSCPGCGRRIRPWENIPVLSWLALRGRCRGCGRPIGLRYPAVELLGGGLALLLAWRFGPTPALAGGVLLAWCLLAASAIDLEHLLLPDWLTLPLLWTGLLFNLRGTFVPLSSAVVGAVAGYAVLWIVYQGFRLLTGKEGLGRGDFKLLAALGAWLGWQMLPLVVLAGAGAGALAGGAWLLATRRGRQHPLPFGPFLALGGLLALVAGPAIVHAYLGWLHPGP